MSEQDKSRMRQLIDLLNEASNAYYNGQNELMSDHEWDVLFDELKQLEAQSKFVYDDSPTINVSSDNTEGQKEAHEEAMLSLAKTKKIDDLVKWASNKPIWISWKLDGLTLVATYDKGKLTKVLTRGDGHTGTNITHLSKGIYGLKDTINEKGHVVIRGEAVISYEDFDKFVLESGADYANPRNLASGSLSLKDVEELKERQIHFKPFTLVHVDNDILSQKERMDFLVNEGFEVVDRKYVEVPTYENVEKVVNEFTDELTSGKNPYPVDGLVIAYEDVEYSRGGSVTGHHATRAGLAFKWQDEVAYTALEEIEWSCAASTITPVAIFTPVDLEGTTVKRASLCNISECERLGIGSKGTKLEVIKANKIIPKVIKVDEKVGELNIPEVCPVCASKTEIKISEESLTKTLRCTNAACPAKKLKKYARFVSKGGMDIDGISEATLQRFVNEGWIKNYADIYRLSNHSEEIKELDGFGEKSSDNITASIEKARKVNDQKLVFALNIPLVGIDVAKKLLSAYPFEELVRISKETNDPTVFSSINGIGSEKSSAFVNYFKEEENVKDLEDLLNEIEINKTETKASGDKCEGLTFVVTGDVYKYKNRNELKAYIESEGGKVTGSVSKSTSYLINNDLESSSSKNTKAKELGIEIISEDTFIERFG